MVHTKSMEGDEWTTRAKHAGDNRDCLHYRLHSDNRTVFYFKDGSGIHSIAVPPAKTRVTQ